MKRLFFCLLTIFILLAIIAEEDNLHASNGVVYRIPVTGEIDPGLVKMIEKGIREAKELGADLIIFEIDTFGGYVDSAVKIRDLLLDLPITSYTCVKGRAWSAGALITLAGNRIAMKSGSSIGAAETRPDEEKYISAFRKEFKSTAEARGKNPDIAAAMVDADIEIEGITEAGKLLTLTAIEASSHNIADLMAETINDIFIEEELEPARIITLEMTAAEKAARLVIRPTASTVLITIGIIAFLVEAFMLGFGVGGAIGILSLGIVFSSQIFYGGASWGLALLFLLGLVLILLEIFVIPGFGFAGIGGIAFVFLSIFFLFPTTELALSAISIILLSSLVAFVILVKLFGISPFWKRISLGESQTVEAGYTASDSRQDLLGKTARTITPLRPAGTADVSGRRIDVVSEGDYIDKEQVVKIIKVSGSRIVVQKTKEGDE